MEQIYSLAGGMEVVTYEHGGDIYSYREKGKKILDFSSNINPLGLPAAVEEVFKRAGADCIFYPDPYCRSLRRKIAAYEGVPEAAIVCGNGAADLIDRIVNGLKPSRVLVTAPAFSEYEAAAFRAGAQVFYATLQEKEKFAVGEAFLQAILRYRPELVFLCNPNNPTGKLVSKEMLLKTAALCEERGALLVVDECFLDFLEDAGRCTMVDELENFSGLVILKAFTKFFAMPGLRLGYLLSGNEKLREAVWKAGQPWNVSSVAQSCGIAALTDEAYIAKTKKTIPLLRRRLYEDLETLPIVLYPGAANYLMFRSEFPGLERETEKRGILIRSCSNYHGLTENYYRVAVKSEADNRRLAGTLKEILMPEGGKKQFGAKEAKP